MSPGLETEQPRSPTLPVPQQVVPRYPVGFVPMEGEFVPMGGSAFLKTFEVLCAQIPYYKVRAPTPRGRVPPKLGYTAGHTGAIEKGWALWGLSIRSYAADPIYYGSAAMLRILYTMVI